MIRSCVFFLAVGALVQSGAFAQDAPAKGAAPQEKGEAKTDASKKDEAKAELKFKPLSEEQLEKLLSKRMNGGLGRRFAQFSNLFLAMSSIQLGTGVGLAGMSKEIAQTELQPVFPESYKPTLREILDALALQTKSQWKHDPSGKQIRSEAIGTTIEGLSIFEFEKVDREKPFEITLAEGWKSEDMGHWVMYSPPDFPLGMDIYEMGSYSPEEGKIDEAFVQKIRQAVALEWAKRVSPKAVECDFKPAKVGEFEALYFEAMIPSKLKKEVRWRQWVFMDGGKCYFVVSTILPELEETIFPDVEKMITSFKVKKPAERKEEAEKTKTDKVESPVITPEEAVKKLKLGMPASEVVKILKPLSVETGTWYLGGSGRHILYFAFAGERQVGVLIDGPGEDSIVSGLGAIKTKTKWTRYDGDSITAEGFPIFQQFKASK